MKKLTYYIWIAVLSLSSASCKKYLDIKPKGAFIPGKTSDYRLLLDEVTPREKSNGFVNTYSMDVMMDDDLVINTFSQSFYNANRLSAFRFNEHLFLEQESDPDWLAMYNQIYTANLVVEQVMSSTGGTDTEKRQLLAEARVHRAYAYFILVNIYAKQYDPATAANDAGVPVRQGLDFEEALPRASVKAVYDQVLADLQTSANDLPASPDPAATFRPSKATAFSLLAKTFLFMNNAADAHRYADSSLKYYNILIDYNTLPTHPAFPQYVLNYPTNYQNPETLMEKSNVSSYALVFAAPALLSLYDTDNDLRWKTYFTPDFLLGMNNGSFSSEWSGRVPSKGPSVPETYLIRAESSARLGNTQNALDDLNLLRSKRYKTGSNYTLSAPDANAALNIVKAERRREMAFRGSRYFDIRRFNKFDNANITITHTLGSEQFTLTPNSNRTALPIARKYIALNPEISQNPR